MQVAQRVMLGVVSVALVAGCRTATRMIEEPRVDLEMPQGANRGYLVGAPPPAAEGRKTTRQMVETEIEVPLLMKTAPPPHAGGITGTDEAPAQEVEASALMDTYVVKPGDSLSTIAARPEVFGDSAKWPRLFKANRDVLNNPNQLRPGMTLKIPRGASVNSSEGATTFTK